MTKTIIAPRKYLDKVGMATAPGFLRDGVVLLGRLLMAMGVSELAGADVIRAR